MLILTLLFASFVQGSSAETYYTNRTERTGEYRYDYMRWNKRSLDLQHGSPQKITPLPTLVKEELAVMLQLQNPPLLSTTRNHILDLQSWLNTHETIPEKRFCRINFLV